MNHLKPFLREGGLTTAIEIIEADHNSFTARATAVTDFDGDGILNVWEIDENGAPIQITKD